ERLKWARFFRKTAKFAGKLKNSRETPENPPRANSRRSAACSYQLLQAWGCRARDDGAGIAHHGSREAVARPRRLLRRGSREARAEIAGIEAVAGRGRIDGRHRFRNRHVDEPAAGQDDAAGSAALHHDLWDARSRVAASGRLRIAIAAYGLLVLEG